jgi:quercetin dioxygenase-like cupin family protein
MPIPTTRLSIIAAIAAAVLIAGNGATLQGATAQQNGLTRTDLQRHDLSIPGREAIQVRVGFAPGAVAPRHSHPGEEIVYVLEGSLEYEVDGQPPVTLKAGDVLFIPAGVIHGAKNVGTDNAAELATYVVEKGKPLVVLAD